MSTTSRRRFLETALALGATAAWGQDSPTRKVPWRERRDVYPAGGCLRRSRERHAFSMDAAPSEYDVAVDHLTVEVAGDDFFPAMPRRRERPIQLRPECGVLAGGSKPSPR